MAKEPSESKTPLIVALVFFVLVTLTLGVLYYLSIDDKAQAVAATKAAESKATDAEGKWAGAQEQVLLHRAVLGVASQEDLDALKNARKKEEVVKEYALVRDQMKARLGGLVSAEAQKMPGTKTFDVTSKDVFVWPAADAGTFDKAPDQGLIGVVVSSYGGKLLASQKQASAETNAKRDADLYAERRAAYDAAAKSLAAVAATFPAERKKEVEEIQKTFDAQLIKLDTSTKKHVEDLRKAEEAREAAIITAAQAEATKKQLDIRVKTAEGKAAAGEDPFAFEKPHGRIVSKNDQTVTIDLGSADNVRPGLTFTVQPADTPSRGLDSRKVEVAGLNGEKTLVVRSKGTIEVLEVLGPKVSRARIVTQENAIRDAVLAGDVLYNAAWRKGAADHVALFGLFDMDADGSDDIKTLVRDLNKVGVTVDAYYDLEKGDWQGKITPLTAYAVEGYMPVSAAGDALSGAKSALTDKLNAARAFALGQGVRVVRARDFFPRVGYKMRLDITPDIVNRAYSRYLPAVGTPPPATDGN